MLLCGTEGLGGVIAGKNEKGRQTNSGSLFLCKGGTWSPEKSNHMPKAYDQPVGDSNSNPRLMVLALPPAHHPCLGRRIVTVKLTPPRPQERGHFKDLSGKRCPLTQVLPQGICDTA